jgi:hypothetical protein
VRSAELAASVVAPSIEANGQDRTDQSAGSYLWLKARLCRKSALMGRAAFGRDRVPASARAVSDR